LSMGCGRSEKRISPATVKKVRGEKESLSPERAQILASGFKQSLPRKISYVIPALTIFAIALFFGRGYWQPLFHAQQPHPSATQPAMEDKAKETTPEVQSPDATVKVPDSPAQRSMDAAPETTPTPIPPSPPATTSHASAEVRVKEIIEVKEGTTLNSIAYRYYKADDETFLDHILKLNPEITNPNLILVNQKIKIPEITESSLVIQTSEPLIKIHLKTFRSLKKAEKYRLAASIKKETEIVPLKVSPVETWYRVIAGPFAAKDDGLKFIREMNQKGFPIIPLKTEKP
jgi:hypothetical protein